MCRLWRPASDRCRLATSTWCARGARPVCGGCILMCSVCYISLNPFSVSLSSLPSFLLCPRKFKSFCLTNFLYLSRICNRLQARTIEVVDPHSERRVKQSCPIYHFGARAPPRDLRQKAREQNVTLKHFRYYRLVGRGKSNGFAHVFASSIRDTFPCFRNCEVLKRNCFQHVCFTPEYFSLL